MQTTIDYAREDANERIKLIQEAERARLKLWDAKDRIDELELALRNIWDHADVNERIHGLISIALENAWSSP